MLRPICYTDKKAILAFHGRLSPDTRFLRFHYYKSELTEHDLEIFCNVDYHINLALVAEMFRGGCIDIVGVGRYSRLPCLNAAEVAFVVEDAEQSKGIGTHLLKALAGIALEKGINTFIAELLHENVIMMDIFRKYDPHISMIIDGNSCRINFSP
jgi:GNAT superfamily N-acetyltransferase